MGRPVEEAEPEAEAEASRRRSRRSRGGVEEAPLQPGFAGFSCAGRPSYKRLILYAGYSCTKYQSFSDARTPHAVCPICPVLGRRAAR